jgi:hypothetical protein
MPEGYDSMAQVSRNIGARLLSNYPWLYGVLGGILLVTGGVIWLALRQLRRRMQKRTRA